MLSRFVIAFLPRSKLPKIITTLQEKENATFANVVALEFLLTETSILRTPVETAALLSNHPRTRRGY